MYVLQFKVVLLLRQIKRIQRFQELITHFQKVIEKHRNRFSSGLILSEVGRLHNHPQIHTTQPVSSDFLNSSGPNLSEDVVSKEMFYPSSSMARLPKSLRALQKTWVSRFGFTIMSLSSPPNTDCRVVWPRCSGRSIKKDSFSSLQVSLKYPCQQN